MKVVLVTGSRNWSDWDTITKVLTDAKPDLIITGSCATGADHIAEQVAKRFEINYRGYPAKWGKHANSAGPRRNAVMAEQLNAMSSSGHAVVVLAFPQADSKGTQDMISRATKLELKVEVFV